VNAVLLRAGEKRARVEAMFDRIAHRYDLMNRLMTFGMDRAWRRAAIAALKISPRERLIDLACGTGDLALEGTRAGARVIGFDLSAGMLREAQKRAIGCMLVRGDALSLPIATACCDAVVSGFALRNFADVAVALAEAARVLKPNGALALLEIDTPARRLVRFGHRLYFQHVVPVLGRLLSDVEAYSYLPASVAYLPTEPALHGMLQAAGFRSIEKRRLSCGVAQLVTARRCREREDHVA
jgi:demethylmenaquinone methyltransferase / 2-methoxy-6-polyprenyl-1,4-benzoquinol methylase